MYSFLRLKQLFFLSIARLPMRGQWRAHVLKIAGVNFAGNSVNHVYIGQHVTIDTMFPENITLGKNIHITSGCVILTHYYNPIDQKFYEGKVGIEDGVFIGVNSVICKAIVIGKGAVVAAGSIVTKDISPYELWGGNPAKFIKKLNGKK